MALETMCCPTLKGIFIKLLVAELTNELRALAASSEDRGANACLLCRSLIAFALLVAARVPVAAPCGVDFIAGFGTGLGAGRDCGVGLAAFGFSGLSGDARLNARVSRI